MRHDGRMHVLLIPTPDLSYQSGSSIYVMDLIRELARLGLQVTVLCQRAPAHVYSGIRFVELDLPLDHQVIVDRPISSHQLLDSVLTYTRVLAELGSSSERISIVHSIYGTTTALAGCFARWLFDIPQVVSTFGRDVNVGAKLDKRYARMLATTFREAAFVLTSTPALRKLVHASYGVPYTRLRVSPPGVSTDLFEGVPGRDIARTRLHLPPHDTIALAIQSSFGQDKGLDVLLRALPVALQSSPNLQVVVIGHDDTPDKRNEIRLHRLIAELDIASNVQFRGHQDHAAVATYISAADIIVDPRRSGNFSTSVLESLCVGRCVLASAVDGNTILITDSGNGCLFPVGDHHSLGQILARLCADAGERCVMEQQARRWFRRHRSRYSYAAIGPAVLSCYESALRR